MTPNMKLPGITAVILAILFPIYWLQALNHHLMGDAKSYSSAYLIFLDALGLLVAAMEVYLYLCLRRVFQERLNGSIAATLLALMASVVVVFAVTGVLGFGFLSGIIILMIYALLAAILAIVIIANRSDMPPTLIIFAAILLVCALLQFSMIMSMFNIFIFPLAIIVLAIFCFRKEHQVEVV